MTYSVSLGETIPNLSLSYSRVLQSREHIAESKCTQVLCDSLQNEFASQKTVATTRNYIHCKADVKIAFHVELRREERDENSKVYFGFPQRLRYLKRQARKAVEYLAVGIAASGAGYGMPAGFNPTAFRSECTVYPEVYTLEQLRWMSNYKKNLYSIGHLAT